MSANGGGAEEGSDCPYTYSTPTVRALTGARQQRVACDGTSPDLIASLPRASLHASHGACSYAFVRSNFCCSHTLCLAILTALLPNGRVPGTNGHAGILALIMINLTLTTGAGTASAPRPNRRTSSDPSLPLDHACTAAWSRCAMWHATRAVAFRGEQEVTRPPVPLPEKRLEPPQQHAKIATAAWCSAIGKSPRSRLWHRESPVTPDRHWRQWMSLSRVADE